MPHLLRTEPTDDREPPAIDGLDRRDGEWCLRVDYYEAFIERVTGVAVGPETGLRELELVRSRLEGCIESYERTGGCRYDEFDRHEHVDSIDTVRGLARFFRSLSRARVERGRDPAVG
jgi:hypothetical protein